MNYSISHIPSEVRRFLIRALLLFIAWKTVYMMVLIPNQVPDAPLVRWLGNGTSVMMNMMYQFVDFDDRNNWWLVLPNMNS